MGGIGSLPLEIRGGGGRITRSAVLTRRQAPGRATGRHMYCVAELLATLNRLMPICFGLCPRQSWDPDDYFASRRRVDVEKQQA